MTTHRDSTTAQFQATIDALQHSSISTKLSVIDGLNDEIVVEQNALEAQRNRLHQHKQLVADLTTDLKGIQAGEEYTVSGGGSSTAPGLKVYVDASYAGASTGSAEAPFASLAAAIDAKCAVDDAVERIFVIAGGVYTVSKTIVKDVNVKQKVSFVGQGAGVTFLEAAASFTAGKDLDCLKLSNFGGLRFEKLTIRRCRYGIRAISCDDLHITHCSFTKCGSPATDTYYDGSISQSAQATAYANDMSSGGAVRVELAQGVVRLLHNQVRYCFRGLRCQDCVFGGLIQGNVVKQTVESGCYLASSSSDGNNGCQGFIIQNNDVNQACNNSYLVIGGRDNVVADNVARSGFNSGVQLWSACQTTVSGNKIEKCNTRDWNGLGVLGDSWAGGVSADGDTNIYGSATYQVKIFDNHITECGIGRAAENYAIRIANDAFAGAADKCYVGGNQSSDADVHFKNDQGVTVVDMDTRSQPGVFSAAEKVAIQADVTALQTAHPITPVVIENLSANDNTTLQATDRVVFFKHSQVHGLICTLPASGVANGHTIYIKNLQTGSSPVRGWGSGGGSGHAIKVVPGDAAHKIDIRFDEIILEPSSSTGVAMENENEACRLVWLSGTTPPTWVQTSDSY